MTTMYEEFDDLFGGQYLCEDFANGVIHVPVSFGVGAGQMPVFGGRRQQPCLSAAEKKRQERNAREKQRSFRITKQIEELKELLMSSGVKVRVCMSFVYLVGLICCTSNILHENFPSFYKIYHR